MSVFKPFRLTPKQADQSESEGFSSSGEGFLSSQLGGFRPQHPLRSILKKASKVLKSDIAAARYLGEVKRPNEAGLPSFSLSGINEASVRTSGSVETAIRELTQETPTFQALKPEVPPFLVRGRLPTSPPKRSPSSGSPSARAPAPPADISLALKVGLIIEEIKSQRSADSLRLAEVRQQKAAQVLGLLQGMKELGKPSDHSLVNIESEDSGSETESGSYSNNRLAMKLAIRQYASNPQQREELLHLIETSGTPRLSILMRNNRVEGLYTQGQNGFLKVYGGVEAPDRVQPSMIRKCFEFKAESLSAVPPKQLWKADAFSL